MEQKRTGGRMYLSIHIVRAMVEELVRQDVALPVICERLGVEPEELADASLRVPLERCNRAVAEACKLSNTPAFGLHVGASAPIGALHVVGHVLASCASTREAVQLFERYSAL